MGNILSLSRNGWQNTSNFTNKDNLVYTYETNSNKLKKVLDNGNDTYGFKDGANLTTEYTYDANANLITDANKGITSITYNHLNLPTQIKFNNSNTKKINYIYAADGSKLRKVANDNGSITTSDYAGNGAVYENNVLQFIPTPEGYVMPVSGGNWRYVYQYKDHLGSIRLSYSDGDGNGTIAQSEIIEENNYQPFGLKMRGFNTGVSSLGNSVAQRYKFGGKEFSEELNLNTYDFGARNYDPALGRWMNIDPLAEQYQSYSSYNYSLNSPIKLTDKDGNVVRDPDGNIVFTSSGVSATGFQQTNRVVHSDGSVTETYLESTYDIGNIYADNGTSVEAYSLVSASQRTITYDSKGNVVTDTTSSVDKSKYDCGSDCHGNTFADNKIWINNDQVQTLLDNDGYLSSSEGLADIAVFKKNGKIVHSAKKNKSRPFLDDLSNKNYTYDDNAGILKTENNRTLKDASRGLTGGKFGKNNVRFYFKGSDKILSDKRLNSLGKVKKGVRKITKKKEIAEFLKILNGN